MRLDIADLRLFLCVVEAGSITQGAQQAHLALASASERLRSIEEDAGVPLLERRPRGVASTEAGEALAHHARLILQQQALLKGDFDTAYKMSNPAYRSLSSLDRFRGRLGSAVSWVDAKVVKVECEPEKCQVTLEVGARPVVRAAGLEPACRSEGF